MTNKQIQQFKNSHNTCMCCHPTIIEDWFNGLDIDSHFVYANWLIKLINDDIILVQKLNKDQLLTLYNLQQ